MMKKLLVIFAMGFAFAGVSFAAVDLNSATQAQLESVKGIGPAKAKAIIEYRAKNGSFKTVDDLDNVPGFGKATVGKVRAEVSVGGGSAPKVAKAKSADAKKGGDAKKGAAK
jgi:competence protein ComEA